jgi:parallel beta-helix repeat protein
VASYVPPGSNVPNSKTVNSCRTIHNVVRIMSDPRKNNKLTNNNVQNSRSGHYTLKEAGNKVTNNNVQNSRSGHYTHKVAGRRLFDDKKKPSVKMPGCFSAMPSFYFGTLFFHFLLFSFEYWQLS